jgi:hypothetical protein
VERKVSWGQWIERGKMRDSGLIHSFRHLDLDHKRVSDKTHKYFCCSFENKTVQLLIDEPGGSTGLSLLC